MINHSESECLTPSLDRYRGQQGRKGRSHRRLGSICKFMIRSNTCACFAGYSPRLHHNVKAASAKLFLGFPGGDQGCSPRRRWLQPRWSVHCHALRSNPRGTKSFARSAPSLNVRSVMPTILASPDLLVLQAAPRGRASRLKPAPLPLPIGLFLPGGREMTVKCSTLQ